MKILCMNYEYPPIGGGGAAVCQGLAEELVRRGHLVDVVTSGMKGLTKREEVNGVHLHRVKCIRRNAHYATTPELLTQTRTSYLMAHKLIKNESYAINHTHFIIPTGLSSYFLWLKTKLPYVITMHGSDVPGYNPDRFHLGHLLVRPLWKKIIENAACIISPSNYLKDLLLKYVDAKVKIIPNGINLPELPDNPKQNRIIIVTRMFKRKGVQHFLEAINGLDTDWEICIAGDGPYLPDLKLMAKKIDKKVRFFGFIKGQELLELYQSAKIFVFPSIQENFPVVLLEGMNANCAVITTTAAGCAEVVQDAGIKVEPGNVEQLRTAIKQLIEDQSEIDRFVELGKKRLNELSWQTIAKFYENILVEHTRLGGVQDLSHLVQQKTTSISSSVG